MELVPHSPHVHALKRGNAPCSLEFSRLIKEAGSRGGSGAMRPIDPPVTSDLWYKNAIIYCLDVEKYLDRDGDGVGDFAG